MRQEWDPKQWVIAKPDEYQRLLDGLRLLGEDSYLTFNRRVTPGLGESYGVRVPYLRKVAASLRRNSQLDLFWDKLVAGDSHEERLLAAMLLGELRPDDFDSINQRINRLLPRIDNWAVCDTAVGALGDWVRKDASRVWKRLSEMVNSSQVWTRRLGVVMLLHFQNPGDLDRATIIFDQLRDEREYYVLMGMAWVASYYFFVEPEKLCAWLKEFPNDEAVNLTVRKIIESRKADAVTKLGIREYKRL